MTARRAASCVNQPQPVLEPPQNYTAVSWSKTDNLLFIVQIKYMHCHLSILSATISSSGLILTTHQLKVQEETVDHGVVPQLSVCRKTGYVT